MNKIEYVDIDSFTKGLLKNLPSPAILTDEKLNILEINSQAKKFLRKNVNARSLREYFEESKLEAAIPEKNQLIDLAYFESYLRIPPHNIKVNWQISFINNGSKALLIGDLNKDRIDELLSSIEFYEHIIDNMPGHVYWKDRAGKLLGCNRNLLNASGFKTKKEIIGTTAYDALPKKLATIVHETDKKVLNTGKIHSQIEPFVDIENNTIIFFSTKVPLKDNNDEIIGVLGISVDITAEKEAERLKFEKIALEKQAFVNKEKREAAEKTAAHMQTLAATIAHELRTPLGAIDGMASWLELVASKVTDRELKHKLMNAYELISGETAKTNAFITIILESLTELKDKSFEKTSVKSCVMEAVDRFPYEADEKKLVHTNQVKDFTFIGNQEMVIHVLFNLIKNALYFIQAANKGEITIWTERGDDYNYLHFKDTGKGMPQDKADKIFDKFFTDTGVGTGIGLYFCKNAMNIMGGDIVCKAKEGEFAHFILSFPKIK